MCWLSRGLETTWTKPFNEPAVAGGSIKPRVERSETLGVMMQNPLARETGDRGLGGTLCRPLRGLGSSNAVTQDSAALHPGLYAAARYRRLIEGFHLDCVQPSCR